MAVRDFLKWKLGEWFEDLHKGTTPYGTMPNHAFIRRREPWGAAIVGKHGAAQWSSLVGKIIANRFACSRGE